MNLLDIVKIDSSTTDFPQNKLMEEGVIPRFPASVVFVGRTGCGKSNLLVNFITLPQFYRGFFDQIWLFSETGKTDGMYKDLELDDSRIITEGKEFEPKLTELVDQQKAAFTEDPEECPSMLVIFEDITPHAKFQRSIAFQKCFTQNRHLKMSSFACVHKYTALLRVCRLQASNIFFYKASNSEKLQLAREHGPSNMEEKEFVQVIDWATAPTESEPKPFLHIACKEPEEFRYRRNLKYFINILPQVPTEKVKTNKRKKNL